MTAKEEKVCREYKSSMGKSRCSECPLVIDKKKGMCRANSLYDRERMTWVLNPNATNDCSIVKE